MNVTRIRLRDFRSYARLDLELPDGATAIIGPNGAGKSSLLTAVDVALFGARSLEPYLRHGGDRLTVGIELDHAGERYEVWRSFDGRSMLDFKWWDGVKWRVLTLETQKETQHLIERTLGLTRATFRASAYLAQGDAAALTSARPADRMQILRDTIGGLGLYEKGHERAKVHLREARESAARLAGSIDTLKAAVANLPGVIDEEAGLAAKARDADSQVAFARQEFREALEALRLEEQHAAEEMAAHAAREAAAREVWEARQQAARAARAEYDTAMTRRKEAIVEQTNLRMQAEWYRLEAEKLRDTAAEDEEAGPGKSYCAECGQQLGMEALAQSVGFRREHANDHMARSHDYAQRAANVAVPSLPDEDSLPPEEDPPEREPAPELRDLQALREGVARTERALKAYTDRLNALERDRAIAQHRIGVLQDADQQRRDDEDAYVRHELDAGVLEIVAEMFSPTGIPLLIIENAIPLIEQRAQEVLEQLGGETASCRIELRTQRPLKTSDALKDTLDIVIHAPGGEALEYEHWSGGEKMRLDLAIRIGLAQLLLTHGAQCEIFAVDEPDGLDIQGRAALVEIIEEMRDRYGFRKVLLISHDESLRDSFAQTLEVARTDGGTSTVVGSALEAVPA